MKVGVNVTKGAKSGSVIDFVTVSYTRNTTGDGYTTIDLSSYNPSTIKDIFVKGITNLNYVTDSWQDFFTPNLAIIYNSGEDTLKVSIAITNRTTSLSCNLQLALVR